MKVFTLEGNFQVTSFNHFTLYYFLRLIMKSVLYENSMGSLVSIENFVDPHDQKLLRGHDMQVCNELSMSNSDNIFYVDKCTSGVAVRHFSRLWSTWD